MAGTIMQSDSKVKLARAGFPLVDEVTYLDTASVGPVSRTYMEVLENRTAEDVRIGRAYAERFERIDQAKDRIRSEIGSILAAEPEQLVLTQGTTSGIRTLVERFPWHPGDEILTTDLEFPRCVEPLAAVARDKDLALRIAAVPSHNAHELGWLEACITSKTRLIVCSGVAYATGQRLPIDRITELARIRGVHTLIDGAQLIGAAKLDLNQTPVDFLALPLQKWLGGPEGLGALFIRAGTPVPRLEDSTVQGWPVLEATASHLAWLRDNLGWDWIFARTRQLSSYARDAIRAWDSDRLMTPTEHAGIVAVNCIDGDGRQLFDQLSAAGIVVRHRPELGLFRISTAFINSETDIDRFAAAMAR
jgi:L-cysteine/cystine lyase